MILFMVVCKALELIDRAENIVPLPRIKLIMLKPNTQIYVRNQKLKQVGETNQEYDKHIIQDITSGNKHIIHVLCVNTLNHFCCPCKRCCS